MNTLGDEICLALNGQINREFLSSYLYLDMSIALANMGYQGAASWMKIQASEELDHAIKICNYVTNRGARIELAPIQHSTDLSCWNSLLEIFESAYSHERMITGSFNDLSDLVDKSRDNASKIFLNWFILEQVEEEASFAEIISHIKLAENERGALLMVDLKLGERRVLKPESSI